MSYWYVGSPYSKYEKGFDAACEDVALACVPLIQTGMLIHCPITHLHPIAKLGIIDPLDDDVWRKLNRPYLDDAVGLIVVMMPGWRESNGLTHEIRVAMMAGKPIMYLPFKGKDEFIDADGC